MAKDRTIDYYRLCFNTESGKRVLANLLLEAKFFEYATTPEELAVENFVKTILTKTGAYNKDNIDHYVDKLLSLPYRSA